MKLHQHITEIRRMFLAIEQLPPNVEPAPLSAKDRAWHFESYDHADLSEWRPSAAV